MIRKSGCFAFFFFIKELHRSNTPSPVVGHGAGLAVRTLPQYAFPVPQLTTDLVIWSLKGEAMLLPVEWRQRRFQHVPLTAQRMVVQ